VGGSSGSAFWVEAATNTGTGVSGEFWGDGNYPYTTMFATFTNNSANPGEEMQVTLGTPEPSTLWLCAGGLALSLLRRNANHSNRR
jgi:hypothetical protein